MHVNQLKQTFVYVKSKTHEHSPVQNKVFKSKRVFQKTIYIFIRKYLCVYLLANIHRIFVHVSPLFLSLWVVQAFISSMNEFLGLSVLQIR